LLKRGQRLVNETPQKRRCCQPDTQWFKKNVMAVCGDRNAPKAKCCQPKYIKINEIAVLGNECPNDLQKKVSPMNYKIWECPKDSYSFGRGHASSQERIRPNDEQCDCLDPLSFKKRNATQGINAQVKGLPSFAQDAGHSRKHRVKVNKSQTGFKQREEG